MARLRAPQLLGRGGWIGASPDFGLGSLSGKFVVLHFWTSSSINCMRVLVELHKVQERFGDEVVIVGIHSPKFPHEHEHQAVERAVERLSIRHPVLDDPDLDSWQQFGVKGWPTLVLIDPEGFIVGGIAGEGGGAVVAATIDGLIADHGTRGTLVAGPVMGVWASAVYSPGWRTLSFPGKVAVDPTGRRLAIADTGNNRVLVTDRQGRVEQLYPLLTRPQGVRFDGDRLVVCDTGADRVVAIDRASGQQTVLIRDLASPWDVDVLADGSLLVAEAGRHRLWHAPAGGGEATAIIGTGQEGLVDGRSDPAWEGGTDSAHGGRDDLGPHRAIALLAQPSGVAALPDGGAVFVDAESSALRVLAADGSVVTLVGQGLFDWGASDGGPDSAALQHPLGVTVAPTSAGDEGALPTVYLADSYNGMVRSWTGTAWTASAGTLRTLPVAGLGEPGGLAALPDGRLIVADTNNSRVLVVDPGASEPHVLVLDESWIGTLSGDGISVPHASVVNVPFDFDIGDLLLDVSNGPPVRIDISAEPGTLLAAGPRRWVMDVVSGAVGLRAGTPGDGILVVEVEVRVCDDTRATTLRSRARHDLTVLPEPSAAAVEDGP